MQTLFVIVLLSLPKIGAYAIFAVGIVLMYRASRILNLAHGAMAMVPAYVVYTFSQVGVPVLFAVPLGIAAGAGLGLGVERVFIRRLHRETESVQTVATVAALGFLVAVAAKVWGTTSLPAPRIFPDSFVRVGESGIRGGEIGIFVVMLILTGLLLALFKFTDIGLYIKGAAENRRAASLMGVNPDRTTDMVWALGGGLAAIAGILLSHLKQSGAQPTQIPGVQTADPEQMDADQVAAAARYAQQNHPEAFGKAAAQIGQEKPDFLHSFLGKAGMAIAAAALAKHFINVDRKPK
jgi:branched-subunit amino acid ABC-type transport system permease component